MIPRPTFASDFEAAPLKWSGRNVTRLLRLTGERPARIDELWSILGRLGMGTNVSASYRRRWPAVGGVFDHGGLWARSGRPWAIVGHPYSIRDDERRWLGDLRRFGSLKVYIDDRPSYYGFGTHHVRIELPEPRRPHLTLPSTPKTSAAKRAARKAFAQEFPLP